MEQEILSAISVASDPRQDRGLQAQALEYLNQVRSNPLETWRVALGLFLESRPDGSRSHDPQTRIFALQVLDDLLESR